MTKLIELWDRAAEQKVSVNPDHIVSMRALTADELDEDGSYGTAIELVGGKRLIVINKYDEVYSAANDA